MENEQILDTSHKVARFVTNISGWVDRHGKFWGENEALARWSGCTHISCPECGEPTPRNYTLCEICREKKAIERYKKREHKQWEGKTPLYSDTTGEYFFDENELQNYLVLDTPKVPVSSLRLIICKPVYLRQLDEDYFYDELPENGELPAVVLTAIEELNKVIRAQSEVGWEPGKYAAIVSGSPEKKT